MVKSLTLDILAKWLLAYFICSRKTHGKRVQIGELKRVYVVGEDALVGATCLSDIGLFDLNMAKGDNKSSNFAACKENSVFYTRT